MPKNKVTKKSPIKKHQPTKKTNNVNSKVKLVSTKQGLVEVKTETQPVVKKDNRKYVKVYDNDPLEKRKEIGERLIKKEIRFAYYASDGPRGVWYYLVL